MREVEEVRLSCWEAMAGLCWILQNLQQPKAAAFIMKAGKYLIDFGQKLELFLLEKSALGSCSQPTNPPDLGNSTEARIILLISQEPHHMEGDSIIPERLERV